MVWYLSKVNILRIILKVRDIDCFTLGSIVISSTKKWMYTEINRLIKKVEKNKIYGFISRPVLNISLQNVGLDK